MTDLEVTLHRIIRDAVREALLDAVAGALMPPPTVPTGDYLTSKEAAARMHISVETLYHRRSGGLPMPPAVKLGRSLMWRRDAVDSWLRAQEGAWQAESGGKG